MKFKILPADKELGYTPYFWLIYTSFFVFFMVVKFESPLLLSLNVFGLVFFLCLYFRGYWLTGNRLWPVIIGLTGLGVALMPINPGANAFFIYAAAFLGEIGKPRKGFMIIFVIMAVAALEAYFLDLAPYVWVPAVVFPLIVGGPNIHFSERKRLNRKLLRAQEEVEELAKIAERERIARDLHDLLGHTLSVTVLKADLAGKLIDRDREKAKKEIHEIEIIARNALKEVREAVQGYRSYGIDAEISHTRHVLNTAEISLTDTVDLPKLDPHSEKVLALCLREAITNIIRHAQASHCDLSLIPDGDQIKFTIADNGSGFNLEKMGSGLRGMRERVENFGGQFNLNTESGTCITIHLPGRGMLGLRS